MSEKQSENDFGELLAGWKIPEYEQRDRSKNWYIGASIVALLLLIYSFSSGNFLFALIIIIAAVVMILNDGQKPAAVKFYITDEGIIIGGKFYDYDEIKDFSIVYKPKQEIKNLYFELKNPLKPRISIPLEKMNPLPIRENLLKYLDEDLDRTDQPLSETLARFFKL